MGADTALSPGDAIQQFYNLTTTLLSVCPFAIVESGASQEYHDALVALVEYRRQMRAEGFVLHDETKWIRGAKSR